MDIDRLSEALRPYAHRYGAALGDGEGAVRRFLTEAGLPRATEQAAELVRDKGLSETLAKMTLSDPEMMQRAIARMTLSDPEMIQRAIAKITNSDVRQMLDRISAPSMQRDLKQANRALEAARKVTK